VTVNWLLLQVYKTLWNEILERRSLDVDQLSAGTNDYSWPGFLTGAEVCSAVDNFAQVINRLHTTVCLYCQLLASNSCSCRCYVTIVSLWGHLIRNHNLIFPLLWQLFLAGTLFRLLSVISKTSFLWLGTICSCFALWSCCRIFNGLLWIVLIVFSQYEMIWNQSLFKLITIDYC